MIEPGSESAKLPLDARESQRVFREPRCAIGIDVGGTKIAAGLVQLPDGVIVAKRLQPTSPARGGKAVLEDVITSARLLIDEADTMRMKPAAIGIGLCELVGLDGEILSDATVQWKGQPIAKRIQEDFGVPVRIDADVRVAARAEAYLGAGCGLSSFLYVTVGTGISASLVVDGAPYGGARGLTGTFASAQSTLATNEGTIVTGPPLEEFSAGPAIAARLAAVDPGFRGAAPDALAQAEDGSRHARAIVESAGHALGAAVAQLVNMLDPDAIVLGGGLGLASGLYRDALDQALRQHVWADEHRGIAVISGLLGTDAGMIGAALGAVEFFGQRN